MIGVTTCFMYIKKIANIGNFEWKTTLSMHAFLLYILDVLINFIFNLRVISKFLPIDFSFFIFVCMFCMLYV